MILLNNVALPYKEIAPLGSNPLRVYELLFESAANDNRGDCGGTTSWSIKGLAAELGIRRETVSSALYKLLDTGYIQIAGETTNRGNSNNTVWRVTHPANLEAVRYSIELMGSPSVRLKKMRTKQKRVEPKYYDETEW